MNNKQLQYKDQTIQYRLQWSKRKTIGFKVTKEGKVIITAPLGADINKVNQLIEKKAKWIFKKLTEVAEKQKSIPQHKYVTGEVFYFLGERYELSVEISNDKTEALMEDNMLVVKAKQPKSTLNIRNAIEKLFINKALAIITERVKYYQQIIGVYPKRLTLRNQKTRWGSCSSKGNISINWRISIAPLKVVEYIVIHELCHLKELNHSKQFWQLVKSYCPQYKECEEWLKENGNKLIV